MAMNRLPLEGYTYLQTKGVVEVAAPKARKPVVVDVGAPAAGGDRAPDVSKVQAAQERAAEDEPAEPTAAQRAIDAIDAADKSAKALEDLEGQVKEAAQTDAAARRAVVDALDAVRDEAETEAARVAAAAAPFAKGLADAKDALVRAEDALAKAKADHAAGKEAKKTRTEITRLARKVKEAEEAVAEAEEAVAAAEEANRGPAERAKDAQATAKQAAEAVGAAELGLADATQPVPVPELSPEEVAAAKKAAFAYLRPRSWTIIGLMALLVVASACFSVQRGRGESWHEQVGPWSLTATLAFWTVALLLLHVIGNTRYLVSKQEKPKRVASKLKASGQRPGLWDFVIGKDGRLSTSQVQAFVWTFLLAGAFVYFVTRTLVWVGQKSSLEALGDSFGSLDASYLLLLGGPFAAAVAAGLITQTKVDDAHLQKVDAEQTRLRDVLTNDAGSGDLVDAQFFIFNLVAMIWFVFAIAADPAKLPSIPEALVGLTGLSALTYTASKAATANAPAISAVTLQTPQPGGTDDIRPGDLVEIRGINFMPPGSNTVSAIKRLRVRFGSMTVIPEVTPQSKEPSGKGTGVYATYPSDNLLVARVPATAPPGSIEVKVLTGADVESEPLMVNLGVDKPSVTSIEPTILHRGRSVIVRGRFLTRSSVAQTRESLPSVTFGDVPAKVDRWSHDGLGIVVKVPMGAKVAAVPMRVQAAGAVVTSEPLTVTIAS